MQRTKKLLTIFVLLFGLMPLTYGEPHFAEANSKEELSTQALYEEVVQSLINYENEFSIEYTGNTQNIKMQIEEIMQLLKTNNIYLYENISKWTASYSHVRNEIKMRFKIQYLSTKQQEQFVTQKIQELEKVIKATSKTDLEKVKAVHDYAVLNSSYSSQTKASQYSPYTLLTEGKAVCQAYAFFMYRLLEELNFEVKYVKGYANDTLHGWNLVKLGGEWYHIDATWDDPLPDRAGKVRYKYFLVSDKKMQQTHSWDMSAYPKATSEKYGAMHVIDHSNTIGNQIYYKDIANQSLYVMNYKTLKSVKLTSANLPKHLAQYFSIKKNRGANIIRQRGFFAVICLVLFSKHPYFCA